MPSLTELSAASSVAAADQLLINQSGTDKRVTADKFGIITTGTWTPILSTASGSGIVYGNQVGTYVKVGSLVMLSARLALTSKGTASGALYISNFPYTAAGATNTIYIWPVDWDSLSANYTTIVMQSTPGWAFGQLRGATAAAASLSLIDASALTNTSSFSFTAMYQAA